MTNLRVLVKSCRVSACPLWRSANGSFCARALSELFATCFFGIPDVLSLAARAGLRPGFILSIITFDAVL